MDNQETQDQVNLEAPESAVSDSGESEFCCDNHAARGVTKAMVDEFKARALELEKSIDQSPEPVTPKQISEHIAALNQLITEAIEAGIIDPNHLAEVDPRLGPAALFGLETPYARRQLDMIKQSGFPPHVSTKKIADDFLETIFGTGSAPSREKVTVYDEATAPPDVRRLVEHIKSQGFSVEGIQWAPADASVDSADRLSRATEIEETSLEPAVTVQFVPLPGDIALNGLSENFTVIIGNYPSSMTEEELESLRDWARLIGSKGLMLMAGENVFVWGPAKTE